MSIELRPYKGKKYAIYIDGVIHVIGVQSRLVPIYRHITKGTSHGTN